MTKKGTLTGDDLVSPKRGKRGGITNSKRFEESPTIGDKAKELADSIAEKIGELPSIPTSNLPTVDTKEVGNVVKDFASNLIQKSNDSYGGITLPTVDFKSVIPTDLLNPDGLPEISQNQLSEGLEKYANANRAMELYKAGYDYIAKVGDTKQSFHKAQSSIIKAATEEIKVQQNTVKFDIENTKLDIEYEHLNQTNERLKQELLITEATKVETLQLQQKLSAVEEKRNADINKIKSDTQSIIQKYLKDSIATNTIS